jgi:hypothetical protein
MRPLAAPIAVLALASALALGPRPTPAQPVILDVTGNLVDGGTLVIAGSGFGEKATAGPVLWDSLVNIPAYDLIVDGDVIPTRADGCEDCPWAATISGSNPVVFSTSSPRTPDGAAYRTEADGALRLGDLGVDQPDVLFVSWWFRSSVELPIAGSSASNKLVRVWQDDAGSGGRLSWTPRFLQASSGETSWGSWPAAAETWVNLELQVDSRAIAGGGQGLATACIDGQRQHAVAFTASQPLDDLAALGLDASDPALTAGAVFEWTDVYVDTTFARVYIADSPTPSECGRGEIQLPVQWQDDRIEVRAFRGAFDPMQDLYLFVVDPDGVWSEGHLLESNEDVGPGPPGAPTIVTITVE